MSSSPKTRTKPRVLRACDTEALTRATLATPLSEVQVMLGPAGERNADPVADAYAAGLLAGRESALEGDRQETDARREEMLRDLAERLAVAAEKLAANRRALLEQLLLEVGDLAYHLVEELVGGELARREEPVRVALERALRFAPGEADLLIHLNPAAGIAAWELESLAPGRRIRVIADESVETRGCVVEVASSTIDAQIEPALRRLRDALGHLPSTIELGAGE